MAKVKLNRSQTELLESEQASAGSAINTISVQLRLADVDTARGKAALESVLLSADVFSARLIKQDGEWCFDTCGDAPFCEIADEMTAKGLDEYVKAQDMRPLAFPEQLFDAQIIPVREGGIAVYVRFHHIIIDGYGMSLFKQRLLDALAGKTLCKSVFFNGESKESDDAADEKFWQSCFAEFSPAPNIFTETPNGYKKSVYENTPDETLTKKAAEFAKQNGVTLPYVLFAAYALYIAEATDKDEAVILMPRLNRGASEMDTIGCYMQLVPVKVKLDSEQSFSELCTAAMDSAREASLHKGCGYGQILKAADTAGVLSEYGFNFYRHQADSSVPHTSKISVAGAMRNHLTWNVFYGENGLSYTYDCRDGVYDETRVKYFAQSIETIIDASISNKKVKDISILGESEKSALYKIKGESSVLSDTDTIPSLFFKAAEKFASKAAIYAGENSLSFSELDKLTDKIAAALVARGIRGGDSVAFMLPRDIRLIPTMLGILKSGAAFIPVDPAYPKDRIEYILDNSGAVYFISTKAVAGVTERSYLEIDELTSESNPLPHVEISQGQLAYMIYTSGTTGKPKGVMLSHRGIVNIVKSDNNPFSRDITANCRGIVAIGSICFDISLFEIFVPLLNGLFVELGSEKSMFDAEELAKLITKHGADTLHCTPSRLAAYLTKPLFSEAVKNVKAILSAGEVLPQSLVDELKQKYGIRIYNGYGPTETTIGATITEAGDDETIGKPIGNVGVLLLNGKKKLVPLGAVGEICIYGDGVGLGYRGREKETRSKFIEYEIDGVVRRIYRTGDLGHALNSGELIYHGRNDRQIKLRGLRIELSEIERVMGSYPGVMQANCIVRKLGRTEHLIAFYTVDKAASVTPEALKAHMKKSLTAYMIPDVIKALDKMPQTPGGKTDLKALQNEPIELVCTYRAPQNRTEEIICEAFSNVLHIERVGADDNFFEIGGNSLCSIELMLEIETKLKLPDNKLQYTDIYRYSTPAMLAQKLESETSDAPLCYDIDSLDETGIHELLLKNAANANGKKSLGNVLLTGVTGYLGIHIFIELLRKNANFDKIFCLARPNKRLSAERRVKNSLYYYAEEEFLESLGGKWAVVEGDITDPEIVPGGIGAHIDTVINSAANVAHFAYGDALTKINVDGVKNLIAFALKEKAEFYHISTISVGGVFHGESDKRLSETDLYIGQEIYNEYIYTKYLAEHAMLRAAADDGLVFKIMRVGNLQGRSRDGEFQMNMRSNAFTRQLSSYIKMGVIPKSVYAQSVNFSPIDDTAHMIVALMSGAAQNRIFHVYPPHEVAYEKIISVLLGMNKQISVISDAEFDEKLRSMKHNPDEKELVEGLLTERPGGEYKYVPVVQELTNRTLDALCEHWTIASEEYLKKYLTALSEMDMF